MDSREVRSLRVGNAPMLSNRRMAIRFARARSTAPVGASSPRGIHRILWCGGEDRAVPDAAANAGLTNGSGVLITSSIGRPTSPSRTPPLAETRPAGRADSDRDVLYLKSQEPRRVSCVGRLNTVRLLTLLGPVGSSCARSDPLILRPLRTRSVHGASRRDIPHSPQARAVALARMLHLRDAPNLEKIGEICRDRSEV